MSPRLNSQRVTKQFKKWGYLTSNQVLLPSEPLVSPPNPQSLTLVIIALYNDDSQMLPSWDSSGDPVTKIPISQSRGPGIWSLVRKLDATFHNLRSHMLHWRLKILHAATKTQYSQINFLKNPPLLPAHFSSVPPPMSYITLSTGYPTGTYDWSKPGLIVGILASNSIMPSVCTTMYKPDN